VLEDKVKLTPETDGSGTLGGPSMWTFSEEMQDSKLLME
jgi:hypothetical protein